MKKRSIFDVLLIIFMLFLAGCNGSDGSTSSNKQESVSYEETVQYNSDDISVDGETESEVTGDADITDEMNLVSAEPESEIASDTDETTENKTSEKRSDVSLEDIPKYDGKNAYIEINNNKPFFSKTQKKQTSAFETYSELDSLGRCGVAFANICTEIMPTEKRGAIGSIKPSGWHTVKYNGYVEGNYLYNRCHLIGYQLAGENANEKNLITGTRYMNVDGMLPFENAVDDYIEDNPDNHVLYRVTPMFKGDNLVARGVLIEAYSVEDKGKGIKFCVFCYNVQPGIKITYSNGNSKLIEDYDGEYAVSDGSSNNTSGSGNASNTIDENNNSTETRYILNTNTMKFHYPTCYSISMMSDNNKQESTKSRDELIAAGYSPCGHCHP